MYRVVIIDDEALARIGLRSLVDWEEEGFEIVGEASNGKDGVRLIEETHPDLVMTDIVMPVMDGIEMFEEVKKEGNEVPFVFFSSYDQFDLVKKAMKLGALDYLLKLSISPEEMKELLGSIRKTLKQRMGKDARAQEQILKEREERKIECLNQLLRGDKTVIDSEELGIIMKDHSIRFFCVISDMERIANQKEEKGKRIYTDTLRNLILDICTEFGGNCCIYRDGTFTIAFVEQKMKSDEEQLHAVAEAIIVSLKEYGNIEASVGIGPAANSPKDLQDALEAADKIREDQAAHGYGKVGIYSYCNHIVRDAKVYINQHIYENIGLKEISAALYLNPCYLSTVFSREESCGLANYINQVKMKEARRMLSEERMRIGDVSGRLGYENASYFARVFRKYCGMSPKEYLDSAK